MFYDDLIKNSAELVNTNNIKFELTVLQQKVICLALENYIENIENDNSELSAEIKNAYDFCLTIIDTFTFLKKDY
jgi:hemoglobin-like flavoprotein